MPINVPGLLPAGGNTIVKEVIPNLWSFDGKNAVDITSVVSGLAGLEGNSSADCFGLVNTYFGNNPQQLINKRFYWPEGKWYSKSHLFIQDAVNWGLFGNDKKTQFLKMPTALTATATTNGSTNTATFSNMTNIVVGQMLLIDGIPDPRQITSVSGSTAVLDGALPPAVTNAAVQYFKNEYLIFLRYCENIFVEQCALYGAHTNLNTNRFGEQGLYIGSSTGSKINYNSFYNFGDAACRTTTSGSRGELDGSFYGQFTNNYVENCSQVTTTPGGDANQLGGCQNYLVEGNTFINLKGSIKAATRRQVGSVTVRNNTVYNTPRSGTIQFSAGIEVIGRNNLSVTNNTVYNSANYGILAYSPGETGVQSYQYGNYFIADNTLINCYRGILMQNNPFPVAGSSLPAQINPQNIRVIKNRIVGTTSMESAPSGIAWTSSGGSSTWGTGCECRDNELSGIANGNAFSFQNVANSGNVVNGILKLTRLEQKRRTYFDPPLWSL